ncbi:DnaJ C-terminal domain-containing protein [Brachybacterium hainanense]|uniref:DnaJ C-terminal domain-containing protein n=1 Tax=Brachybacterium hainanense TaxID=1541174 RepID=A0ABV6RCQ1_9MICO
MSGQDWLDKDFYAVLGVSKDADSAAIKKAYRKKAKELHPDRHPDDPTAEDRFKAVGEAYSVLNDAEQRQQYDAIRAMGAGGARFTPGAGGGGAEDIFSAMFGGGGGGVRFGQAGGNPSMDDIFSMFGGGGAGFSPGGPQPGPLQGEDLSARVKLTFRQAAEGLELPVSVGGRSITARIPAGVHDGQRIRLRGKGSPGQRGGKPGDLLLTLEVAAHPVWSADGADLHITVPIRYDEAVLGTVIAVPLLDGGTVKMKVAPGTPGGRVLRAKGRGLKTAKRTGDLKVTIQIDVPAEVDGDALAAVEALSAALADQDPRSDLAAEAAR